MTTITAKNSPPAWPLTALDSLGRHWHVEYYVGRIQLGCVGSETVHLRNQAEGALRSALSYDY